MAPLVLVVPYVGTWIEICSSRSNTLSVCRRSLRGNVDRNHNVAESIIQRIAVVPYVGTWIEI